MICRVAISVLMLGSLAFLSGCAGNLSAGHAYCSDGGNWNCIASAPVFSDRTASVAGMVQQTNDPVAREFDRRHKTAVAADRRQRIEKLNGIDENGRSPDEALARDDLRQYRLVSDAGATMTGGRLPALKKAPNPPKSRYYERRWRLARQTLYIGGEPEPERSKLMRFPDLQAVRSEIAFRSIVDQPLTVAGACNGPVRLYNFNNSREIADGRRFSFVVPPGERNRNARRIAPGLQTDRCEVEIRSRAGALRNRISIVRDNADAPEYAGTDGRFDLCTMPAGEGLSKLERVFYSDRWLSQTCVMPSVNIRLLPDAREGYNAKVYALLGSHLPDSFFDAGDPMAPLDFSGAPDLLMIYASYLDIKADFSGRVFERLLRYHAARGTPIRIMVTQVLERKKDRKLLETLAADYPNVQLQEFTWRPSRGSAYDERLSEFHKTHHIKLLATLSRKKGQSRIILGGRNVHDGFLYKKPLDLSRYPDLHTYAGTNGLSLNYYSNYRDFDIEIVDEQTVRTVASHFSTIWNRDTETNVSTPFSVDRVGGKPHYGFRHFISVPYSDAKALEHYYVELFDAAEQSIEIVNPYLNPTPALQAAIARAIARGVKITIISRINLKGDLGGKLLTELNEMFVEKYADRIKMFEYQEPDVVLHSKLMMIDRKVSIISSVNLNNRSFVHDSENGIIIYDPAVYRRIKAVFEDYRASAIPLDSDVDIPLRYRLLLSIYLLRDAL